MMLLKLIPFIVFCILSGAFGWDKIWNNNFCVLFLLGDFFSFEFVIFQLVCSRFFCVVLRGICWEAYKWFWRIKFIFWDFLKLLTCF